MIVTRLEFVDFFYFPFAIIPVNQLHSLNLKDINYEVTSKNYSRNRIETNNWQKVESN